MNLFCKLKSFFCPAEQSSIEEERPSFVRSNTSFQSQLISKPIPKRLRLLQDLEKYNSSPISVQEKLPILTYIEPKGAKQPQLQEIVNNEMYVIETPKWVAQNQFNFKKKSAPQKENIQCEIGNNQQGPQIKVISNQIQSNDYSFQNNKSMPQKSSSKNSQLINSSVKNNQLSKKVFKFEFEEIQQQTESYKGNQQEFLNVLKTINDQIELSNNSEASIQQIHKKEWYD